MMIYFLLALMIIAAGVSYAMTLKNDLKSFSATLTLTCSFAIAVLSFPYFQLSEPDLLISILSTMRYGLSAVGMSVSGSIMDYLPLEEPFYTIYKTLLYLLYMAGPIFASMFIISFSRAILASLSLIGNRKIHVFSHINDRSLAIAESIFEDDRNQTLIFCNADEADDSQKSEALSYQALVLNRNEKIKIKGNRYYEFYEIADDREKCLIETTSLCEHLIKQKFYAKDRVIVRYFIERESLEMVRNLDQNYGDQVYLRYVDEENASAIEILRKNREVLAKPSHKEVYIIGSGGLAQSLMRNCIFLLLQPGSDYTIHMFADNVKTVARKMKNESPEVFNAPFDSYFSFKKNKEANYDLHFHAYDSEDPEFFEQLEKVKRPDIIFVCRDDDEVNYRSALELKRMYASTSDKLEYPLIACDLKDIDLNRILGDDDGIQCFGNYADRYNYKSYITPEIEKAAERTHMAYLVESYPDIYEKKRDEQKKILDETGYYSYVNQNSSYCAALAMEYRLAYILSLKNGDEKDSEFVKKWLENEKNLTVLAESEHYRWNAYQRLQGWRCADIKQAKTIAENSEGRRVKDNSLLLHPALVEYKDLKSTEKKVDRILMKYNLDKRSNYVELDKDILRQMLKILDIK